MRFPYPSSRHLGSVVRMAAAWALVLVSYATAAGEQVAVISQCGETIPPRHTAYLTEDLDCRDSATAGVVLSDHARLVLAGHSIIGDPGATDETGKPLQGVRCVTGSVCTVEGPGFISGFSASGVAGTRVRMRDVWVGDNAIAGISAFENVRLRNVVVSGNGALAIHAGGHVRGSDSADGDVVEWHAPRFRPGDS